MVPGATIEKFQTTIWNHYHTYKRSLPWRESRNAYEILVSEVMLQQTQVDRVLEKYRQFLSLFPTIHSLDQAPLRAVLQAWQGLGYNRRVLYLKRAAEMTIQRYGGQVPNDEGALRSLPGIGIYTARAVLVFARDEPVTLIETNIRAVFLHHFFQNKKLVPDRDILPFIEKTLDLGNPREWYGALMDYGKVLKKQFGNLNRASAQYIKQSRFHGSNRELRGLLLKLLTRKACTEKVIIQKLGKPRDAIRKNLEDLYQEGLLQKQDRVYVV